MIGIRHPILGREPFAVISDFGNTTEQQIKQHVIEVFGTDYALGGVASLQQMGFRDFPLNSTGKIMKISLEEIVKEAS